MRIERYRGIENLVWCPGPGLNCLIGPGDLGKTTVLDAIATVLSSAPGRVASEHDYFEGNVGQGFLIELLVGRLNDEVLSAWPAAPLWTWWEDQHRVQADPDDAGEGVLCLRAKGTEDLEIEHLVVDPSEGEGPLSPSKRQKFGLATMGTAATAYRELRMSRGSLLYRNIDPEQLRGLVTVAVQATRDGFAPSTGVQDRLNELSAALSAIAPGTGDLALAMLSPRGQNLLGMIGLFAMKGKKGVPLANAGLGTQQLALFTLARLLHSGSPLFVIDEVESGLEPFRQRDLIGRIRTAVGSEGQAFLTTHSPAAVGEMALSELHRLEHPSKDRRVATLPTGLERVRQKDPEALLCRLPVLVEGETELGLLQFLLDEKAKEEGTSMGALGIRLLDGGGQPKVFKVTDALTEAGQRFAAFLDSEDAHQGRRQSLDEADQVAFGTYTDARCLEEALSRQLSIQDLDRLICLVGPDGRDRSDSRYQQLNEHADAPSRKTLAELVSGHGEEGCRQLFCEAANRFDWFKGQQNGMLIGQFLRDSVPEAQIVADASGFWTAALDLIAEAIPSDGLADHGLEP